MISIRSVVFQGLILACYAAPAVARTIVITDADCERMAAISSEAPRLGWAGAAYTTAEYGNSAIYITQKSAFLIVYPLDRIPPGQRIVKAEWTVPYLQAFPLATGSRIQVRRILQEWGPGVSHLYRMTRPQRLEWHTPGAHGAGQDRSTKATAVVTIKGTGEHTFNVTEDVELWYTGAVPNFGWLLTADDPDSFFNMHSPFWNGAKGFKLRITYEPQ